MAKNPHWRGDFEWLDEAKRRFPDLQTDWEDESESPYMLWFTLTWEFAKAYDDDRPEMVKRIYEYADWCGEQPEGTTVYNDLGTVVAVCFHEHIPTHPKALADMPRWWSREEVVRMKQLFSYHLGEDGYMRILTLYDGVKEPDRKH